MVNLLKTHSCKTILISSSLRDWDLLVSTRYISRRIRPKLPPTPNSKKYISGWSDKNVKNKWLNWHSSDIQAFRSPKSQMFILSLGSRGKETILFSQYMYVYRCFQSFADRRTFLHLKHTAHVYCFLLLTKALSTQRRH